MRRGEKLKETWAPEKHTEERKWGAQPELHNENSTSNWQNCTSTWSSVSHSLRSRCAQFSLILHLSLSLSLFHWNTHFFQPLIENSTANIFFTFVFPRSVLSSSLLLSAKQRRFELWKKMCPQTKRTEEKKTYNFQEKKKRIILCLSSEMKMVFQCEYAF